MLLLRLGFLCSRPVCRMQPGTFVSFQIDVAGLTAGPQVERPGGKTPTAPDGRSAPAPSYVRLQLSQSLCAQQIYKIKVKNLLKAGNRQDERGASPPVNNLQRASSHHPQGQFHWSFNGKAGQRRHFQHCREVKLSTEHHQVC